MLRALRIELTPGAGLCGTQPVEGPLRALSCGAGLKIYTIFTIYGVLLLRRVRFARSTSSRDPLEGPPSSPFEISTRELIMRRVAVGANGVRLPHDRESLHIYSSVHCKGEHGWN